MNYIHVHEKCLKCGECRLECEHRTKWTSASTSTSPNTESDKSIDEWFMLVEANRDVGARTWTEETMPYLKSNLYSLLMDVIGENELEHPILEAQAGARTRNRLRAEQRQKLKELFGKEK